MPGLVFKKNLKESRLILATIAFFVILLSLPLAIYLVQQRQEIRKRAAPKSGQTSPRSTPTPSNRFE
jgi:hypothetical protein